jgi:hypothetical protein
MDLCVCFEHCCDRAHFELLGTLTKEDYSGETARTFGAVICLEPLKDGVLADHLSLVEKQHDPLEDLDQILVDEGVPDGLFATAQPPSQQRKRGQVTSM